MKLKKQIILIAAICMLFGVAGYSLNNQKASADTDNDRGTDGETFGN